MYLKDGVKLSDLISKAKLCKDDVYYKTDEGDVLNLKSLLTQLLLQSIANSDSSTPEAKLCVATRKNLSTSLNTQRTNRVGITTS